MEVGNIIISLNSRKQQKAIAWSAKKNYIYNQIHELCPKQNEYELNEYIFKIFIRFLPIFRIDLPTPPPQLKEHTYL